MLQPSTYASWITHQNTQKPSLIVHRRCRSSSRVAAAVTAAAAPGAEAAAQQESHAAVQQLVSARQLDPDPCLVAQEAHLALSYLASQPDALPAQLNAVQLAGHALLLTDLMATGSTFRTLQMIKRHPALLRLPPEEVANRVLQLKLMMPAADISRLLYQKPTLLLIDDLPGVVGAALNKLHALMPGIPVEAKLHEGGTVFWSFSSLLQDHNTNSSKSRSRSSRNSSGREEAAGAAAGVTHGTAAQQQQHADSSSPCSSSPDARLSHQQC